MLLAVLLLTGCGGCGGGESKAVTLTELIRENYARDMEAKHDAEGREHIEIPEGAETVTVEGIEYTVVRDLQEIYDMSGNYILANDVKWVVLGPQGNKFTGRFHGNNYKVYGGGYGEALFEFAENAVIQNIVISSDTISNQWKAILADVIADSLIKDCVNYCQPSPENKVHVSTPMIWEMYGCEVSGLINYADFYSSGGAIIHNAYPSSPARPEEGNITKISNCINYGNIVLDADNGQGGIVGNISYSYIIENCINYGSISGTGAMGGIAGAAKKATNCENKGTWNIHKGRAKHVGDLVGYTIC